MKQLTKFQNKNNDDSMSSESINSEGDKILDLSAINSVRGIQRHFKNNVNKIEVRPVSSKTFRRIESGNKQMIADAALLS